jgi:hypothetical protein
MRAPEELARESDGPRVSLALACFSAAVTIGRTGRVTAGRWVAVVIMVTGIAVLGLLAGSLASFFRLDDGKPSAGSQPDDQAEHAAATSGDAALQGLAAEVSALRHQVEALAARLTGALPGQAPQEPA